MLKAIETKYKGYRFRSRLEARWAVFFDALGVAWEYEKEGYNLGAAGWYLPDFWIKADTSPGSDYWVWAEVKPVTFSPDEIERCKALTIATNDGCIMLEGLPAFRSYEAFHYNKEENTVWKNDVLLHFSKGRFWWSPSSFEDIQYHLTSDSQYVWAVEAARSARFEHGEMP